MAIKSIHGQSPNSPSGAFMAPTARTEGSVSALPAAARQISLQAFSRIAEAWDLTTEQQITLLGSPPRSTFFKWKKEGGSMPPDTLERLSHLLGIWKSLRILFTVDKRGEEWIRRPNEYFDGLSALDVMLSGKFADLVHVRRVRRRPVMGGRVSGSRASNRRASRLRRYREGEDLTIFPLSTISPRRFTARK